MELKLTDEMHLEVISIMRRIVTLTKEFGTGLSDSKRLSTIHKDELESYKRKLEIYYSDTDLKE